MMSDDIAQAVLDELLDPVFVAAEGITEWPLSFLPEKIEVPDLDLAAGELENIRVSVMDWDVELSPATRTGHWHDYQTDIAIQYHVGNDTVAIRKCKDLVENIMDHFRLKKVARLDALGATFLRARYMAHRLPENLLTKRCYGGYIALIHRVLR